MSVEKMNLASLEAIRKKDDILLAADNLRVWFPIRRGIIEILTRKPRRYVRAVDGISFYVRKKEIFCLAGESGCGKTTTGKVIMRLVPPTSGRAFFKPKKSIAEELQKIGVPLLDGGIVDIMSVPQKKTKPLRKDIQIIYQDPFGSLNPRFKVGDILEEPLKIHGIHLEKEELRERIFKALEEVKLTPPEDIVDRYPHQLSGGQRQRVSIARALMLKPSLIVADEPVSMLDVSIRAEILELLDNLRKQEGISYIFITHDLAVARYVCDRIAIMYLGKIVEMGDARKVIEDPLHPYTRALVAAIPEPDPSNRLKIRDVPIKGEVPSASAIPPGCRFHPRCIEMERHAELAQLCKKEEPKYFMPEKDRIVACWCYKGCKEAADADIFSI